MTEPVPAALVAFGRTVAEPKLSPDARRIAFVSSSAGRASLVTVALRPGGAIDGPELAVTADPPPAAPHPYGGGTFDWTPDGAGIVYAARNGGLYLVPSAGGAPRAVARPIDGDSLAAPAVSPDGRWVAYQQEGPRSAIAIASLAAGGGWPTRVTAADGADFAFDPAWAPDGKTLVWHEWDVPAMPWDAGRIMTARLDPAARSAAPVLVTGGNQVSVGQPRYSPDGRHLGYVSDLHGWKNVHICDTVAETHRALMRDDHEHADPTWGPGARSFAWSIDGARIAFTRNESGFGRLCVGIVGTGEVVDLGKGVHVGLSWSGSGEGLLGAVRTGARTPNQVVVYDLSTGARHQIARGPLAGWDTVALPEPEPVSWTASDGATVFGRLYRPASVPGSTRSTGTAAPGRPPMIVSIHGGPTSQTAVAFNPRFAFWLSRGWAILVPDHRGSTGWGRAYQQAMAGRWGELDADDTAAGIVHAIDQGWCDPRRVVVMGGSAGGFTALGVLARHPGLCAAGVDLYGVADLLDLDETTHRYEKHYLHSIVGPLPGAAERYFARSPVHFSERIDVPLLILQGEADKVVPPAQSRAIADAIRRRGGIVETHFYEGEGHGWGKPETVIDELERTEDFLRRHVLRWRR